MTFTPKTWRNYPNTTTPITAEELNRIEQGVKDVDWVKGRLWSSNNLNDITESGSYIQPQASSATTDNNYPLSAPGELTVRHHESTDTVIQTYTTDQGVYVRSFVNGGWREWAMPVNSAVFERAVQDVLEDPSVRSSLSWKQTLRNNDLSTHTESGSYLLVSNSQAQAVQTPSGGLPNIGAGLLEVYVTGSNHKFIRWTRSTGQTWVVRQTYGTWFEWDQDIWNHGYLYASTLDLSELVDSGIYYVESASRAGQVTSPSGGLPHRSAGILAFYNVNDNFKLFVWEPANGAPYKLTILSGVWREWAQDPVPAHNHDDRYPTKPEIASLELDTSNRLADLREYVDITFEATAPGGASDEAVDAAIDRAILSGKIVNVNHTPYEYGAVGDGVTDDSEALIQWLEQGGGWLGGGAFRVDQSLEVERDDIVIDGYGSTILAGSNDMRVGQLTGDGIRLFNTKVDGRGFARSGFHIYGINSSVAFCDFKSFQAVEARGLHIQGEGGAYVAMNRFEDLVATGTNESSGAGFSRAVVIYNPGPSPLHSTVFRNSMINVLGGEGDSITILNSMEEGGRKYTEGNVTIAGNYFDIASRRYIKIQAGKCEVYDNIIEDTSDNEYGNPAIAINPLYSDDIVIKNNLIKNHRISHAVYISAYEDAPVNNIQILDNKLNNSLYGGMGIYASHATNVDISRNEVDGGVDMIRTGNLHDVVIKDNVWRNPHTTNPIVTGSGSRYFVKDNVSFGNNPVSVSAENSIIESNYQLG